MKSAKIKVLHEVAGLPLVCHVAQTAVSVGAQHVALVTGRDAAQVERVVSKVVPDCSVHEQTQRLGTAHAVLAARTAIERGFDDVLVLYGDTPLIRPQTLRLALDALSTGAAACVVGFRAVDPSGYGRLIMDGDQLLAIREDKDATESERQISFCNGGVMALAGERAMDLLDLVGNRNAKAEYYLTDIIEIARSAGLDIRAVEADESEVLGVNTRVELAEVEAAWQGRRRREAMLAGATLVAPETVFFSHDTVLGSDVTVEPHVVFGPAVAVANGATIHAFSHLEGASVGENVSVGPFARLRAGTRLASGAKVGNFCETKNVTVEAGAKINHLTYVGDARIGAGSNIGAGTITCNYDGAQKHFTDIGENVFVGSNSSLVAPITLGDGAYIGSGSVLTQDVPAEALAVGRARQVIKEGRSRVIRERAAAAKAAKAAKAETSE